MQQQHYTPDAWAREAEKSLKRSQERRTTAKKDWRSRLSFSLVEAVLVVGCWTLFLTESNFATRRAALTVAIILSVVLVWLLLSTLMLWRRRG